MNLKEQHMVTKRYLKSYCIKDVFLIIIAFSFVGCMNRNQDERYDDNTIDTSFFHTPFVAINVSYKNNIHRMVMEENLINSLPKERLSGKMYRSELYPIFRNDTLVIDSITFNKFIDNGCLVVTQKSVDSVCCGEIKNILSSFFDENGILVDSLSEKEQSYIIYLLFQHKVYLKTDCETGLLHIIN